LALAFLFRKLIFINFEAAKHHFSLALSIRNSSKRNPNYFFIKFLDFLQTLPILYDFTNTCLREFNTQGPLVMQLKAETNRYLNKFHDERRQRLALLLDSEEWRPAEVPKELQEAIDDVLAQGQGQTGLIPVRPKRPGKLISQEYVSTFFLAISPAAEISGDKFVVIGCSLLMIKMINVRFHRFYNRFYNKK
jgi:hypothetical protein